MAAGKDVEAEDAKPGPAPVVDEGMRRWYESCPCCMSQSYPEVKQALDEERALAR